MRYTLFYVLKIAIVVRINKCQSNKCKLPFNKEKIKIKLLFHTYKASLCKISGIRKQERLSKIKIIANKSICLDWIVMLLRNAN